MGADDRRGAARRLCAALAAGDLAAEAPVLGPHGALLRALALVRAGLLEQARAAVGVELGGDPALALAASAVLFATRDYQRGLDVLAELPRRAPAATHAAARRTVAYASALGWERAAAEAIARGREADPRGAVWPTFAAQSALRAGDLERAAAAAEAARALAPEVAGLRLELAGILAEQGDAARCRGEIEACLERAAPAERPRIVRAGLWITLEAGALDLAEALGEEALERDPDDAEAAVLLADLALWRGDRARASARAASARGPIGRAGAARIRGQVALAAGQIEAAVAELQASLAAHETAEAHVSLAEARISQEAWEEAHASLSRAHAIGEGYPIAAWILRFLAAAGARPGPEAPVNLRQFEEFAEALVELAPAGAAALAEGRQGPLVAAARAALARLGCNRSRYPTCLEGNVLRRVSTRTGVRHASRQALQTIRAGDPGRSLALLAAAIERWPRSSLPLAHRGELRLWLGDDEGARADLESSLQINPRTRWAYVGLTLLDARAGDPAAALARSERGVAMMAGTIGPAVFAHRAGARRAAGDLAGARADLERAAALHPTRIGAWVELGLTCAEQGDRSGLGRAWGELRGRAPGLVSDAAAAAGIIAWRDGHGDPDPAGQAAVVARCLEMLRGNRSSTCVTYFTARGELRAVPHGRGEAEIHARDEADLAGARALVLRGLGVGGAA